MTNKEQTETADLILPKYLKSSAEASRKLRAMTGQPQGLCLDEFILNHGQSFESHPLPDEFERGKPNSCYINSGILALESGLHYVEGYLWVEGWIMPIRHAWCVRPGDDRVIDVTVDVAAEYFGIAFSAHAWLESYETQYESCSILVSRLGLIDFTFLQELIERDKERRTRKQSASDLSSRLSIGLPFR